MDKGWGLSELERLGGVAPGGAELGTGGGDDDDGDNGERLRGGLAKDDVG